ncbi:MAG: hypothetical protein NC313_16565 [Butyrivibrio sp.]|nr:hypothetical protein [Butyrivibrio sp.]
MEMVDLPVFMGYDGDKENIYTFVVDYGICCRDETVTALSIEEMPSVAGIRNVVRLEDVYYVLDENGIVWKWNEDKTKEDAELVEGLSGIVKIVDAGDAVYALTEEGDVYAWGSNQNLMIESEGDFEKFYDEPVRLSGLAKIKDIDAGKVRAFAVDTSGKLFVWGKDRYRLYVKNSTQPKPLKVENNPELTENVKEIFMGADSFHYFIMKNGNVISFMNTEYNGIVGYIFPTFRDECIRHWWDDSAITYIPSSSNYFYCLYEMGVNNDISLISADDYTMYMYKTDNTLWYWNSDRIIYHDYQRAGTKIDTQDLDYNGRFEQINIESILGIEADNEKELKIVSICPGKENALFLLNNGQVFVSGYVTTEVKDIEYYYIVQSNPQNSAPDIEYNMHLKSLSFYKLDYENIVSISSDKDSNFYLADESGNIMHYVAIETEIEEFGTEIEDSETELEKFEAEESGNSTTFKLTEQGKKFLSRMCFIIDDFSGPDDMDEDFWDKFIFCLYTNGTGVEHTDIYREDYGYEYVAKVSLETVEADALLTFGIDLPDIKPSLEDMKEGYAARFYQDGYYYIGVSDFMDIDYIFDNCIVYEEGTETYVKVTYIMRYNGRPEGLEDGNIITYTLSPADNENGFIILSKTTE